VTQAKSTGPLLQRQTLIWPQGPWQDIAVDSMGPLPSGDYVFAVTDCYSRYVEISISKRTTVEVTINNLKKVFATHRLPYTVTSDNGLLFMAETFETFLRGILCKI